jgi:RNA 2',3'-cyclic 3'-phosphodiesterase
MKRTFIGVRVDAGGELKVAISTLRAGLKNENIKWVDISNMHVTLAFIGSTEEPMIKRVVSMLNNDFESFGIINFRLSGFGVFRNFNDPRIIWTAIEDHDRLTEAHEKVKNGLGALNIKLEDKQFKPHLTIARIKDLKDKENLQKLTQKYANIPFQDVTISEIVYYESVLLPSGPLYKPISTIRLTRLSLL